MKVNEIFNKKRIIAFVMAFAMVVTSLSGISFASNAEELDDKTPIYRLYNANTSDHFFTASEDQRDEAVAKYGYTYEKVAYYEPLLSDTPVYCMVCPNSAEHIYSANIEELSSWVAVHPEYYLQDDGDPVFYSADATTGTAVYQFFNPNQTADKASHMGALEGSDDYNQLIAWQWQNDGVKFYAYPAEEPEELVIEAMQTGANKITVSSNIALTSLDDVTLMRGENEQDISVDISEDGKTLTLTTTNEIADDEYTVIVTPADEEIAPAMDTFEGEEAEIAQIAFVSDKFVLMGNPANEDKVDGGAGFAAIRGFNQFGEMVILEDLETTVIAPCTNADLVGYDNETGVIAAVGQTANTYIVGNQVSATAVYQDGTNVKQASAVLTVSAARNVSEISFGEVSTTSATLVGQRITHEGLATGSYYIPVEATDQYGIDLTADDLNGMLLSGSLIISPIDDEGAYAYVTGFDELDDGTVAMMLDDGAVIYPGTQPITVLSVGGTQGSTSVTIEDARWINSLTVSFPALYAGEEAELSVTAIDQYGVEFTAQDLYKMGATKTSDTKVTFKDKNGLTGSQSSIEDMNANGVFKVTPNTSKKTLKITYTPGVNPIAGQESKAYSETFIVSTATPTVATQSETVKPAGTPAAVSGIADGVETVIGGITEEVDLSNAANLVFKDSYGKTCEAGAVAFVDEAEEGDYYYTIEAYGIARYTVENDGEITSLDNGAGSDKYTVTLYDPDANKLDSRTVTVSVSSGEYLGFQAGFVNTTLKTQKSNLYTGKETEEGGDNAGIAVYAVDTNGNTVRLAATTSQTAATGAYIAVLTNNKVDGATLSLATVQGECGLVVAEADGSEETQVGTASVDIYFVGEDGLTLVDTIDITCTNADPETVMIAGVAYGTGSPVMYDLSKGITAPLATTKFDEFGDDTGLLYVTDVNAGPVVIGALDQYGMISPVETATYNASNVTLGTTTVGEGGSLVVAAGELTTRIAITVK